MPESPTGSSSTHYPSSRHDSIDPDGGPYKCVIYEKEGGLWNFYDCGCNMSIMFDPPDKRFPFPSVELCEKHCGRVPPDDHYLRRDLLIRREEYLREHNKDYYEFFDGLPT